MRLLRRRRAALCRGCLAPTDGEHAATLTDPAAAAVIEQARVVVERWALHGRVRGYVFVVDVFGDSLADLEQAFVGIDSPNAEGTYRPLEEPAGDAP